MSKQRYTNVKRYKRAARWPDGRPRFCVACKRHGKARRARAVVTAMSVGESGMKLPVGYCKDHIPEELGGPR